MATGRPAIIKRQHGVNAALASWRSPQAFAELRLEAVLAATKPRLMFNSVEYFVSDDPLFATLVAAVSGALGTERAVEPLAA